MNKLNLTLNEIKNKNFYTHFILTIVSLVVIIFQFIAIFFIAPTQKPIVFYSILTIIILSSIILVLLAFSFFSIYRDRADYKNKKLLKVNFGFIISIIVLAIIFITTALIFNSFKQTIIIALSNKDNNKSLTYKNYFYIAKNIFYFLSALALFSLIIILSINIVIKKEIKKVLNKRS
ncbi:hypothetical protein DMC14_001285 [Metamycoplasma phocicerebrale]|uniref:Uncharacterized protein n=1 Tax=Metamycoplasma phocicerebrale TaxID=142649 RepID=A0A3T0TTK9_9BACT|nr:hypothetical protein [Metamycoplasma phocicerebrale]AZZ65422.1 hypothetical protein DMC14_001285 [Metamycoplasma phocicerebrale]